MKKVEIKYNKGLSLDRLIFEQDNEVQSYIDNMISNNFFGLPERWVIELNCTPEDIASSLEEEQRDVEEMTSQGLQIVRRTFYKLPVQYTFEITDISPDYKELRKREYMKRVDPFFHVAQFEALDGRMDVLEQLKAERAKIKQEIPKPELR